VNCPSGASCGFNPPAPTPAANGSVQSTLTITGAPLGTTNLTVHGASGTLNHDAAAVSLTVNGQSQSTTTWNSWDVVTQPGLPQAMVQDTLGLKTATVELYESTNNSGVTKGSLFSTYNAGAHPQTFNHVQNYWAAAAGSTYPYAGKSTVGRGLDTGETNAPPPSGVFDFASAE